MLVRRCRREAAICPSEATEDDVSNVMMVWIDFLGP